MSARHGPVPEKVNLLASVRGRRVQVAAADQILAGNPLGGDQLFLDLDPTSACVAAAHWLKAAADVVSAVSGHAASQVVLEADNIEAIPVATPTDVLELIGAGHSPTEVVTSMIRDAMAVADGYVPDLDALLEEIDEAEEVTDDHVRETTARAKMPRIRLTPLDPRRPARDMLEDLLTGIRGCWLLYYDYAEDRDLGDDADEALDQVDDEIETNFCNEVRAMAASHRHRLGLGPPPTRPAPTELRLVPDDSNGEATFDINLEADDTCEQFVAAILESEQPDLPRDIIESVLELEHDDSGRLLALLFAHGIGYLVTMKEAGISAAQLDAAVTWVGTEFGVEYAGPAAIMAGLAGHRQSQRVLAKQLRVKEPTFKQLVDFLGPDLFPATIWLCTGLVSTAASGDITWLRRYRPAGQHDPG